MERVKKRSMNNYDFLTDQILIKETLKDLYNEYYGSCITCKHHYKIYSPPELYRDIGYCNRSNPNFKEKFIHQNMKCGNYECKEVK